MVRLLFFKIVHIGDRFLMIFWFWGDFLIKLKSRSLIFQEKWPDRFFKLSKPSTPIVTPLMGHGFGTILGGFWEPKSIFFE